MTTATVASVAEAAQALLDTAEAALATASGGPVTQAWMSPGMPAFDVQCDFVAVWEGAAAFASSGGIPASQQFRTGPRITIHALNVTTGRCLATGVGGRPPTVAQKTADAVKHMEDGQALWNGVSAEIAAGELFGGTCSQITLQGMVAYTPQGGVGGWNLTVAVQIDGYPVTL